MVVLNQQDVGMLGEHCSKCVGTLCAKAHSRGVLCARRAHDRSHPRIQCRLQAGHRHALVIDRNGNRAVSAQPNRLNAGEKARVFQRDSIIACQSLSEQAFDRIHGAARDGEPCGQSSGKVLSHPLVGPLLQVRINDGFAVQHCASANTGEGIALRRDQGGVGVSGSDIAEHSVSGKTLLGNRPGSRDAGACAAATLDQAETCKLAIGRDHGVAIDAELFGKRPDRRKSIALCQRALLDEVTDAVSHIDSGPASDGVEACVARVHYGESTVAAILVPHLISFGIGQTIGPILLRRDLLVTDSTTGSTRVKRGLAEMLKGGVIMDVVTADQARIAEDAGAVAVMALERVPADIRSQGGVARMSDPDLIDDIIASVSIPVMAKARIGHFVEAQVLQQLGVDYIDESEVLSPADYINHIDKWKFDVPFVCGATNLGEALRRITEGAAMIRSKGEAGTGDVSEATKHIRTISGEIRSLAALNEDELYVAAKNLQAPYELVAEVARTGKLPVVLFVAGGVATPADAAMMMQLGADGVFVGSGIFKSGNPAERAAAIVKATTFADDPAVVAEVSRGLGEAMVGINVSDLAAPHRLAERGW